MLRPVSTMELFTAHLMFQSLSCSSCLYLARKCKLSSTEIPKAMLNTTIVDGFSGMPKCPIIPAVNSIGIKLGIKLTNTMRQLINNRAMMIEMAKTAILKDNIKLLIK